MNLHDIEKLMESLNLIYYEYDHSSKSLIADQKHSKRGISDELIKITHALTSRNIPFYVGSNQRLYLKKKETMAQALLNLLHSLYINVRNSQMNIYVLGNERTKWAKSLALFEVIPLEHSSDFSSYDALIFTSKNAIYAVDAQSENYKNIPTYVIAPQTAQTLKELNGNLEFVGKKKHGNAFARELLSKLQGKRVLYLRGESVVSKIASILNAEGIECDERIVYKTQCKEFEKKKKVPKGSVIIFSSPSTIECFFKNMEWDESYIAISIGKTTASYFPSHIKPYLADTTSLESCVRKAIEIKSR